MRYIMEDSTNYSNSSINHHHHHNNNNSGVHLYPPEEEAPTHRRKGRRTSRPPPAAVDQQQSTIVVVEPTEFDVLCAKEKFAIVHTGTRRFRTLIDDYQGRYADATTKEDKMRITKEIVGIVERTGRFLRYTKGAPVPYEELTHLEARDKTSHALRTACKRFKRKMNRQTQSKELLASSALMPLPLATERPSPVRSGQYGEPMPVLTAFPKTTTTSASLPSMARPPIVRRFTTNELAPLPLHSSISITEGSNTFSDDFLSLLKQQVFDDSNNE